MRTLHASADCIGDTTRPLLLFSYAAVDAFPVFDAYDLDEFDLRILRGQPVVIILTGFYQGLNPAPSHSGFDYLSLGRLRFKTGDWFHQLHHQYFNLNYGNTPTPFDKVFGSWHDGSKDSLLAQKQRLRERRRQLD